MVGGTIPKTPRSHQRGEGSSLSGAEGDLAGGLFKRDLGLGGTGICASPVNIVAMLRISAGAYVVCTSARDSFISKPDSRSPDALVRGGRTERPPMELAVRCV